MTSALPAVEATPEPIQTVVELTRFDPVTLPSLRTRWSNRL